MVIQIFIGVELVQQFLVRYAGPGVALWLALAGPLWAIGLQGIVSESTLFQPLVARVELTGVTAGDLERTSVRFGDHEEYLRENKQKPGYLQTVRLTLEQDEAGRSWVVLRSERSLNEPVLDIILRVSTVQGDIQKSFNLLLDPPRWSAGEPAVPAALPDTGFVASDTVPGVETQAPAPGPSERQELPVTREALIAAGLIRGDAYGPVRDGDRLSLIAQRTRLDRSVTINQMMMAYVRLNPDAFDRGNLSGLQQGVILRIPTHAEADTLSRGEASQQVSRHFRAWEQGETLASAGSPDFPAAEPTDIESLSAAANGQPQESLRILPESEVVEDAGAVADANNAVIEDLKTELAVQRADLERTRQLLAIKEEQLALKDDQLSSISAKIDSRDSEVSALQQLLLLRSDQVRQLEEKLASLNRTPEAFGLLNDKNLFALVLALLIGVPAVLGLMWYLFRVRSQRAGAPLIPMVDETAGDEPVAKFDNVVIGDTSPLDPSVDMREQIASALEDVQPAAEPTVALQSDALAPDPVHSGLLQMQPDRLPVQPEPEAPGEAAGGDGEPDLEVESSRGILDEVDVYLAYGLYHQSEELLTAAIETEPDREAFQVKLLETLLLDGKYEEFEARAGEFKECISVTNWEMIKRYAVDAGVRPSFFDSNASDFTDWVEPNHDDLEFELGDLPMHEPETGELQTSAGDSEAESDWPLIEGLELQAEDEDEVRDPPDRKTGTG